MRKISKPDAATLKALLPYGMIGLLTTKLGQAYRRGHYRPSDEYGHGAGARDGASTAEPAPV